MLFFLNTIYFYSSLGNVTDLRVQLYKKRLQNKQKEVPVDRDSTTTSKMNSRIDKFSHPTTGIVRRTVNNRIALIGDENCDDDDALDPLEKATVDDVSPIPSRHKSERLVAGLGPNGKSRLVVKETNFGIKGKKFKTIDNDSLGDYSEDEGYGVQRQASGTRRDGSR